MGIAIKSLVALLIGSCLVASVQSAGDGEEAPPESRGSWAAEPDSPPPPFPGGAPDRAVFAWLTTGNPGGSAGTDLLGMIDSNSTALDVVVGNVRALRLERDGVAEPSVIGGSPMNRVEPGVRGGTIGGGGGSITDPNIIWSNFGTVGGGVGNNAGNGGGEYATIGGGWQNSASGFGTTIGGGTLNRTFADNSTIGGGSTNRVSVGGGTIGGGTGNEVREFYGTIAGGEQNDVLAPHAAIGGGVGNTASADDATVGGGRTNTADGIEATIGGGLENHASGTAATIAGGERNLARGNWSSIGGGESNQATAGETTISGGTMNEATVRGATVGGGTVNQATGQASTIAGGSGNRAGGAVSFIGGGGSNFAGGDYSVVAGGDQNSADGAYSFAAGRFAIASNDGTFVWTDGTGVPFGSSAANQFLIRASGNVGVNTNTPADTLTVQGTGILLRDANGDTVVRAATAGGKGYIRTVRPPFNSHLVQLGSSVENAGLVVTSDPVGNDNVRIGHATGMPTSGAATFLKLGGSSIIDLGPPAGMAATGAATFYGNNNSRNVYAGPSSASFDAGHVELFDPTGAGNANVRLSHTVGLPTVGNIVVYGQNKQPNVTISNVSQLSSNGVVAVHDAAGAFKATMAVNNVSTGAVQTFGANGNLNVNAGAVVGQPDRGTVQVFDANAIARASIWINGNNQGQVDGDTATFGVKNFRIDHPLDPENKLLYHTCVESPEMMNVYSGNVVTDGKGEAWVELPDYFEALNRDFRYQLTVIGEFAQAIIGSKIADNRFSIRTDKPGVEVSWQVTGVRQDPFAEAHRVQPVVEKTGDERGRYLYPELYGQPVELGLRYAAPQQPAPSPAAQAPEQGAAPVAEQDAGASE